MSGKKSYAGKFTVRFRLLIFLAWTIPAVSGFSFLVLIGMFTLAQVRVILTTPLEPLFIIGSLLICMIYFFRYIEPIEVYLKNREEKYLNKALERMKRFPLHFWSLFLFYLLLTPGITILSAQYYTDYSPELIDWFRIHLIALIVSILVGLPIFFLVLNLFGRSLQGALIKQPHLTIKTKVFMLGALVPLLIDTMMVQYYWSRTNYFSLETFIFWLILEIIAVIGSLMFVRSLGQSLAPLQQIVKSSGSFKALDFSFLQPASTDELGVLTGTVKNILQDLKVHGHILEIRNLLHRGGDATSKLADIIDSIVEICPVAIEDEISFLLLYDEIKEKLIGVAHTGAPYKQEGHFQLDLQDTSMATLAFNEGKLLAIPDLARDPRCNPYLVEQYKVSSALAAPLVIDEKVIGVLISAAQDTYHDYTKREEDLIEGLAQQGASAVQTHQLKEQRKQAEQRLQVLNDLAPDAVVILNSDSFIDEVNQATAKLIQTESSYIIGRRMEEFAFDHSQALIIRKGFNQALNGESAFFQATLATRDGIPVQTEFHAESINLESGPVVQAFIRNITARSEMEDALSREKERAQVILQSIADAVIATDEDGQIQYLNPVAKELTGWTGHESYGKPLMEVFHVINELTRELIENPVIRCQQGGKAAARETKGMLIRRGDEKNFAIEHSAAIIKERNKEKSGGVVIVFRDVTAARKMSAQMAYLATHDTLTGLINRGEFEDRLISSLLRAKAEKIESALCYIDLDQFKVVNDTCGHMAGDELLRQLTALLQTRIKNSDSIARLGGDEFGVIFEECSLDEAHKLADDLRQTVKSFRFSWQDKKFDMGASIGLVPIVKGSGSHDDVMSSADSACYIAKEQGRNRIHIYKEDDSALIKRHGEMEWLNRIQNAFEEDRFVLYMQRIVPLFDFPDKREYFEVLLRMQDENNTLIYPMAFIPAAERYQLMPSLDRWVIRTAFKNLSNFKKTIHCTINLSGQSLCDDYFLAFVIDQFRNSGINPKTICFEITETAAITNLTRAISFMSELKKIGCRFALDDFGSGLSSFAYLKNLKVDYLKIDGGFVKDVVKDPISASMVAAINQIGHVMGLKTIAEFVENKAILSKIKEMGVDYAQGFGIAEPHPMDSPKIEDIISVN